MNCPIHNCPLEKQTITQGEITLGYILVCPLSEWGSTHKDLGAFILDCAQRTAPRSMQPG